jgi:hypothetical protein
MRNNLSILFIYIFMWAIIFFPISVLAIPYQLPESVEVITEPPEKEETFAPIAWRIAPESDKSGSSIILFSRQETGKSVCRLTFSNSSVDISWDSTYVAPDQIHAGDLLIVSGAPIPCNVLPAEKLLSDHKSILYEVRREAGGRTFVENIQVSSVAVTYEEAKNNGWVKLPEIKVKTALNLIKAVNLRTGELMAQQLWANGHSWWVYEETPYRRSWRVR